MIAVPAPTIPFVDPGTGLINQQWFLYLSSLSALPPAIAAVSPTGSPFEYQASQLGTAYVIGGTVSQIRILRGVDTFDTGVTSGAILLAQGDILEVTYTVAPAITFVPA